MPKKSRRKSIKQTQKQEQRQNISIKIGELPTKKRRRRRPRKGPSAPGGEAPMRQLPPVVYQTLPQLTYYNMPSQLSGGSITAPAKPATSIVEPVKAKTSILEDVGMIGTEGPVEILQLPSKRETLKELITPVDIPRMVIDPVETGPMDIPRMVIDPLETGPMDIPRMIIDPVEQPSTIVSKPAKQTTITEPKQKRAYAKSGKYSKKSELQQPYLSFIYKEQLPEEQFGILPESVYTEKERFYASPVPMKTPPTKFREETPEKGFITQKDVNKFFQPKERDTSPKPKPKGEMIAYKGEGPILKGRKSRQIL